MRAVEQAMCPARDAIPGVVLASPCHTRAHRRSSVPGSHDRTETWSEIQRGTLRAERVAMASWVGRLVVSALCGALLWAPPVAAQDGIVEDVVVAEGEGEAEAEGEVHRVPVRIELPDSEIPPLSETPPARRRVRLNAGHLLGNAIVGDLIGAVAGGLVSLAIAGGFGCTSGESDWLGGFQCSAGFLYGIAIGALYGAALGGPLGVLRIGGAREGGGDAGMALLAALLGAGVGSIVTGIVIETTQEPTIGLAIGGGIGVAISTFGAVLLYDGSRPANEVRDEVRLTPLVVPLEGGVLVGLGGALPR